jgi:hypothetical protein
MSTPAKTITVAPLRCPACKKDLVGGNIAEMKLPVLNEKGVPTAYWKFLLLCCPFPECGIVLSATFGGQEAIEPAAGAGLWTPGGRN